MVVPLNEMRGSCWTESIDFEKVGGWAVSPVFPLTRPLDIFGAFFFVELSLLALGSYLTDCVYLALWSFSARTYERNLIEDGPSGCMKIRLLKGRLGAGLVRSLCLAF